MSRPLHFLPVLVLLLACSVVSATAQRKLQPWQGAVAAEAILQSGNVNTQLAVFRGDVSTVDSTFEVGFRGEFSYGEQDEIKNQQTLLGTLTFDLWPDDVLSPFVLGSAEYNFQRQIDLRWQAGGGVKWLFWNDTTNEVSFSSALLFDATMYGPAAGLDDIRTGRASFRLKGKHILLNTYLIFNHLTFLQPSLSSGRDYRWNTLLTLDVPLSSVVALRTSFNNTFESIVAEGRKKNDSKLLFGLKLSL
jgi:hypothetical protein